MIKKQTEKTTPDTKAQRYTARKPHRSEANDVNLSAKAVGERIAAARAARGLTLEALGNLLSPTKTKPTMAKWERGEVDLTTPQLLDVARALSVHPNYIIYGQGNLDVYISPLKVVLAASFPVQVLEHPGREAPTPRFVHVREQPDPSSRGVEVIDDSMYPEFWPASDGRKGDMTIYVDKPPIPGSRVWALWKGQMVLRVYTVNPDDQMRGRFKRFTLLALKEGVPPIPGDEAEILGVVVWNARDYGMTDS